MMAIIGVATGITGFLLHQIIDVIADFKWNFAKKFLLEGDLLSSWLAASAYSLAFVLVSTGIVVLISPSAAGSGTPELISFLNGTMIPQLFNIKTFLVKFASCALAVGAGLPVGPEGPMIHLGRCSSIKKMIKNNKKNNQNDNPHCQHDRSSPLPVPDQDQLAALPGLAQQVPQLL